MAVVRSRTFRSGNSEAVRLPRDVAFGENVELVIARSGDVMTIFPARTSRFATGGDGREYRFVRPRRQGHPGGQFQWS